MALLMNKGFLKLLTYHMLTSNSTGDGVLWRRPENKKRIVIYSGSMPTDLNTFDINSTTNVLMTSNPLTVADMWSVTGLFEGVVQLDYSDPDVTMTATASGTATWAALVRGTPGSYSEYFMAVPVTDINGDGVVILDDVNIVSGNQYTILNFGFKMEPV